MCLFTCNNRRRFSTDDDLFSLNDKNLFNVVVVDVVGRFRVKRSFSLKGFDDERKVKFMMIKIFMMIEHLRKNKNKTKEFFLYNVKVQGQS